MDPLLTENNEPYGPYRFKEIVKEQYLISKTINTSYNEIDQITPRERDILLEFIVDETKKTNEIINEYKKKSKR